MNILFLGSLYPDRTYENLIKSKINVGFAAQVFQKALLAGLDLFSQVQVLSEVTIPSFPSSNILRVKEECFSHKSSKDLCDWTVPYLNLPIIKQISICISYILSIRKTKKADVTLIYEITSRHLLSALIGSRSSKKILIVPDLPEYMSENRNIFYLIFKRIDRWIINFSLKHMDGFILFSECMKDSLRIGKKPYIVLEGIFNSNIEPGTIKKNYKKVLLYTGKIEKWFGLNDLLSAFTQIKGDDYQLWLCGNGDFSMINDFLDKDKRIKYLGVMSHNEVLNLQQQATILVNPRHSYDEYTKYSFPSKTMEYMASGTPTLMCPLESIPKEYKEHLFFFDDESVEGMAKTIKLCLDKPITELSEKGLKASLFIKESKSSYIQGKRVFDFLDIVLNGVC